MNAINQWRSNKKYAAKRNLVAKIAREISPKIQATREAWEAWEKKLGRPYGSTATHEGVALSVHLGGQSADAEVSDTDRALIQTTEAGNLN